MLNAIYIKTIQYKYIGINPFFKNKIKCIYYVYIKIKNCFKGKLIFLLFLIFFLLINKELIFKEIVNNKLNNNILKIKEKKQFFHIISKIYKKSFHNINTLYIKSRLKFGNFIISLNNAIIICELIGCKSIIIEKNDRLYIKNKISYNKYNISIEPKNTFIFNNNNILSLKASFYFYYHFTFIKKSNRIDILKKEIIKNLPIVLTLPRDLYIHIRSGDIFRGRGKRYGQPPLCFYEKILNKFNFNNIIIISENKLNPVINKLLKIYPFIKYKQNNISIDISYLANAYNLVSSKSSFLISIIKLNDKLKYLWEYDFYILSEKYLHLHYSVYDFSYNYTIYKMKASKRYKSILYNWRSSKEQIDLMINEKCINKFDIIPPRIKLVLNTF